MVFGLKNGGATYQNCVHIVLEKQIGRNVEAYIEDIVVKSKKHRDLLDNLKETFNNLRKYKMMLNPKKYMFDMSSGKLLGYMVSSRGIDANPTKVESTKKITTTKDAKRNPEAGRYDGSPQPIHLQVGRTWYDVLQAVTQGIWISVA
jgi:hypothetical protein